MKIVHLTRGKKAIVDDEDYELLSKHSWSAVCYSKKHWYAVSTINYKKVFMHRFLLGYTDASVLVDHKNCNGLDNRRQNLRQCTRQQNTANSRKREGTTSRYKGVHLQTSGKWRSQIRVLGKAFSLGSFSCEKEAAQAYNRAALMHFGDFARMDNSESH